MRAIILSNDLLFSGFMVLSVIGALSLIFLVLFLIPFYRWTRDQEKTTSRQSSY